jgi:hypothetical protein
MTRRRRRRPSHRRGLAQARAKFHQRASCCHGWARSLLPHILSLPAKRIGDEALGNRASLVQALQH